MSENKRASQKYYKADNILHTERESGSELTLMLVYVGDGGDEGGGVMIELYVRMAEWGQYHAKSNITENEVIRNVTVKIGHHANLLPHTQQTYISYV